VDQNAVIVSLVGSVTVIVGIVALLVKSFIADKPKTNGNGTKQSRDCWEQHQTVLNKLDAIQRVLDDRQEIFTKVERKLDEINLSVHSK
jgi:hypothetical protein